MLGGETNYNWSTNQNSKIKSTAYVAGLQESLGLKLNQVAGANAKRRSSNDGNQARRIFKVESPRFSCCFVEGVYKEAICI